MNRFVEGWQSATLVQRLGLILAVLSYVLLVPGVTEPIMTISAELKVFGLRTQLFHESRSIWETVQTLHDLGYTVVAFLIVTFSIIIPVLKALIIGLTWLFPSPLRWKFVAVISKWSMADVFVVAILVAFFTAQSTAELSSELLTGFWWFLGFCLLSIISGQLLSWGRDKA